MTQQKRDLVITRIINAPMELVWKAWTDPQLIKRWWGPNDFTAPSCNIDFREGGTSLVSMASPKLGFPEQFSTWRYTKIVPLKRIEYVHNLSDKNGKAIDPTSIGMPADFPQDLLNIIAFEDLGNGKTKITVTEKDWPIGQMVEMSRIGMEQCLDKMERVLKS